MCLAVILGITGLAPLSIASQNEATAMKNEPIDGKHNRQRISRRDAARIHAQYRRPPCGVCSCGIAIMLCIAESFENESPVGDARLCRNVGASIVVGGVRTRRSCWLKWPFANQTSVYAQSGSRKRKPPHKLPVAGGYRSHTRRRLGSFSTVARSRETGRPCQKREDSFPPLGYCLKPDQGKCSATPMGLAEDPPVRATGKYALDQYENPGTTSTLTSNKTKTR